MKVNYSKLIRKAQRTEHELGKLLGNIELPWLTFYVRRALRRGRGERT